LDNFLIIDLSSHPFIIILQNHTHYFNNFENYTVIIINSIGYLNINHHSLGIKFNNFVENCKALNQNADALLLNLHQFANPSKFWSFYQER